MMHKDCILRVVCTLLLAKFNSIFFLCHLALNTLLQNGCTPETLLQKKNVQNYQHNFIIMPIIKFYQI